MFLLQNTGIKNTTDLIQAINEVLSFYGFQDLDTLLEEQRQASAKFKAPTAKMQPELIDPLEKKILGFAKTFATKINPENLDGNLQSYSFDDISKPKKAKHVDYALHILGEEDSFAESLLVFMADLIVRKLSKKEILVEVNSMGDKDSAIKYLQDMKRFLRKNKKKLPEAVLKDFNEDKIIKAVAKLLKDNAEILDDAPSIMDYLSDYAQKHFYSFLNYMEQMGINYNLNPYLFGSVDMWRHLIFKVYILEDSGEKELIAYGGRYDSAIENIYKRTLPAASLVLKLEKKGRKTKVAKGAAYDPKKKKVYFIQLGLMAKSQGAKLLELMQKENFDVGHSIASLSLLEQYKLALDYGAKYAVILGHKEAIDKTLIIRNLDDQTQKIIAQKDLIKHLKALF